MSEIAEFADLYELSAACAEEYKKSGFESETLEHLMQQLMDKVAVVEPFALSLVYASAQMSMVDKWDKYAWLSSAIEKLNS